MPVFRFRLAKGELGWQIDPHFSTDLSGWDNLPGIPVLRADLGDAEIWGISLPDAGEAVFARLRVSERPASLRSRVISLEALRLAFAQA